MALTAVICFLVLGLAAGTLSGLLGIGGGVIIVPALVFLFGLTQHCAQGTTLALMVPPIGLLAAWTYFKQGYVNVRVAGYICLGFALGGYFGAALANLLSNQVLERVFGAALMLIAFKMLFSQKDSVEQKTDSEVEKKSINLKTALLYIVLGVVAGGLSGLIGIGGGVLIVPALVFLFGMSQHEAQGTTLALMVPPIGLLAALEYWRQGSVDVPIAGMICLGFFAGALLGANLANRLSNHMLARVFGLGMILIALKMLLAA